MQKNKFWIALLILVVTGICTEVNAYQVTYYNGYKVYNCNNCTTNWDFQSKATAVARTNGIGKYAIYNDSISTVKVVEVSRRIIQEGPESIVTYLGRVLSTPSDIQSAYDKHLYFSQPGNKSKEIEIEISGTYHPKMTFDTLNRQINQALSLEVGLTYPTSIAIGTLIVVTTSNGFEITFIKSASRTSDDFTVLVVKNSDGEVVEIPFAITVSSNGDATEYQLRLQGGMTLTFWVLRNGEVEIKDESAP